MPWEELEAGDELRPGRPRRRPTSPPCSTPAARPAAARASRSPTRGSTPPGAAAHVVAYQPGRTRSLLPLPLAHVYGLMVSVAGLHAEEPGASVLMRWFDPAGFVQLVEEHRVQRQRAGARR